MSRAAWSCQRCLSRAMRSKASCQVRAQTTSFGRAVDVPPVLVRKARGLSIEHEILSKRLSAQFDARAAKRIGEIQSVTSALKAWEDAHASLSELQALLNDPTTDAELRHLAHAEISSVQDSIPTLATSLSVSLVPPDPLDQQGCIIELRPGAGGSEASLFTGDLLRMYLAYLSRRHMKHGILSVTLSGGESGDNKALAHAAIEEAVIEVESPSAFGLLRYEAGVHRVQRVPETETKGRTHTSSASIMVLPAIDENAANDDDSDPNSDGYIDVSEVRTDVMRSKGAGGQHVNKTESAVRLTHIPTGLVVRMEDGRSQHKNREKAWKVLRSRLAQKRRTGREERSLSLRRNVLAAGKMGREDKIRTYNYGQQRVTDHRSNFTVNRLDDVMEGGDTLDDVLESSRSFMMQEQVNLLLEEEEGL